MTFLRGFEKARGERVCQSRDSFDGVWKMPRPMVANSDSCAMWEQSADWHPIFPRAKGSHGDKPGPCMDLGCHIKFPLRVCALRSNMLSPARQLPPFSSANH